ncbi:citrulline utilization hydrolase CtlX [Catalinimonas niigatensis]|uniref:citrulline utilization hydrolase CtlX n=1 Tax=Catalinimonas niigatensis TaxID=1397264 RepID=UPI002665BF47|nr:arginine deiminase-related protein [Catalinimonas niigatensis]WPP52961.1 arginine deiminase-related protein [Catalinimonas niigatensis]
MQQLTDTILMIRPVKFGYNAETAENNLYQKKLEAQSPAEIQQQALAEFNQFVEKLRAAGVNVITIDDTIEPSKTDSIFPNNWISTHEDGTVVTYPMWAVSRRLERREDIIDTLKSMGYQVGRRLDYSTFEAQEQYLEGTGSMILDREHQIAYACVSPRTHKDLFAAFCKEFGFKPVIFTASQTTAEDSLCEIYHTNVMMSVGENIAILCDEAIRDAQERKMVIQTLQETGKEIVFITEAQCNQFAGNMLQVKSQTDKKLLVMSEQAYRSLTEAQVRQIEKHTDILYSPLNVIETCGGGSARCMMAEVFLPKS